MSLHAMSVVWNHFPVGGNEKLVMLALADRCNDDGTNLFPSVAWIAQRARISERTVQRVLSGFVKGGFLDITGNADGGAPGSTRRYRLRLDRIADIPADAPVETEEAPTYGCQSDTPSDGCQSVTGDKSGRGRVTNRAETGDTGVTRSVIDPSIDPLKRKSAPARALSCPEDVDPDVWQDWLTLRKRKNAPVTATVLRMATAEAGKAGMTLQQFLEVWCVRGSQGLQAAWLTDRDRPSQQAPPRQTATQQMQTTVLTGLIGRRRERAIDADILEVPAPQRIGRATVP